MHETGPLEETNSDSSESTYWYIQTESRQMGPIFFSRLQQMAHQGKLTHEDRVRRGTTGEWVRVGDLTNVLFPEVDDSAATRANAPTVVTRPQPYTHEPNVLVRLVSSIFNRIEGMYDGIKFACVDHLAGIRTITSWIALVAVMCTLTIVAANQFPVEWFIRTDPLLTYTSIWDELKQKRKSSVTTAEWDSFAATARLKLVPIIARLEKTASTDNRIAQQLLWAGRDYLLKMLDDAREDKSPSELKFADHLQRAQWLREGKDLNGFLRRNPISLPWFLQDTTTLLVGIPLFVVNIWIAARFAFGRRGSTKSNRDPVLS